MSYKHGIYKIEVPTSIVPPTLIDVGLPVVFGTSPVNMGDLENVNKPKLIFNYEQAVKEFGFSNDFKSYTLSEFIYSQLVLYGMAPFVLVNVLDPKKHNKQGEAKSLRLVKGKAVLEVEGVLLEDLKVTQDTKDLEIGRDYAVTYNTGGHLIITLLDDTATDTALDVSYFALDPSKVETSDIIGGIDFETGEKKGLELINEIYPRFRKIPGLLLAPGYSKNSEVAAILETKSNDINGIFNAEALIDIDSKLLYSDIAKEKNDKGFTSTKQFLCYPKVKLGEKEFNLSTHLAGLINTVDQKNGGIPFETPSNKNLKIDGCVGGKDDKELFLGLEETNYLNSQGIITVMNFMKGWVLWGNRTAAYPSVTDVKDSFIPIRRMFNYVGNTLITTFWSKIDNPNNRRLIENVIDSANIWFNSLVSSGVLLGGRVEFLSDENSEVSIMDGKLRFHVYMTPVGPAEAIDFIQEYDVQYVSKFIQELSA